MNWLKRKLFYTIIIGSLAIVPYTFSGEGSEAAKVAERIDNSEIAYRSRRYYRGYRRPHHYRPYRYRRWGYPRYYRGPSRYYYHGPYRYNYNYDYPYRHRYYDGPRGGVHFRIRL